MRRGFRYAFYSLMALLFAAAGATVIAQDWRNASREPVGLAPDPALVKEAVVQVYGARAVGAKGIFGVHTWFAVKPTNAKSWTVYEVIGWRLRWAESVVVVRTREPDGRWFGSQAELYAEKRGEGVDELIRRIDKAARDYPYANEYTVWPGPNSNTFTAWIALACRRLPSARITSGAPCSALRRAAAATRFPSEVSLASPRAGLRASSSTSLGSTSASARAG